MPCIDTEKLRKDLINYYGTAFTGGFPVAVIELSQVENADDSELIKIAEKNGFDLNKYECN